MPRPFKRLLPFLLGGALLAGAAGPVNLAATPISRMDLGWWHHRFDDKQAELKSRPQVIFLGDSIFQYLETNGPEPWRDFVPVWDHYTAGRHAVNLGFRGDTTANLLWREMHGELDGIAPKAAVVLIGANNLGRLHWDAQKSLEGIDANLAELRKRLPGTRILLVSVLPSIRTPWATATGNEINQALAKRNWAGTNTTFVDVTPLFLTGGRVDSARFLDPMLTPPDPPLHPNAQTMARIFATIEPALAAMLGDKPRPPMN